MNKVHHMIRKVRSLWAFLNHPWQLLIGAICGFIAVQILGSLLDILSHSNGPVVEAVMTVGGIAFVVTFVIYIYCTIVLWWKLQKALDARDEHVMDLHRRAR